MNDSGLEAMEPWLAGVMARLTPSRRLALSRKIGQLLRKRNADRIRDNVEPDGSPMAPRRVQKDRRGRIRRRKGKMFPRIALARNMQVRATPDQVQLGFKGPVANAAGEHHFGAVVPVSRGIRNSIRVRLTARRLLGISADDRQAIADLAMDWLEE